MDNETVVPEPQNTPEVTAPKVEDVSISKAELEDIRHRAEVSSQNYERAKKAEARIRELETNNVLLEEEGPANGETVRLRGEIGEIKAKLAKTEVLEAHPELKDKWNDFEKFRESDDNKGMNMKTAAKAFLVEKGLLDPQRKGLERTTGGSKAPQSIGMTSEEVKKLRESDFRKYRDMLIKGQIKV
jgi:hypothetical protein